MTHSLLRLSIRQSARCGTLRPNCRGKIRATRAAATFASDARDGVDAHLPTALRIRNILHTSTQLFVPGSPLESAEWLQRTETAALRMVDRPSQWEVSSQPFRVGIVGETKAGAAELVDVLLDDPMLAYGRAEVQQNGSQVLHHHRDRIVSQNRNEPMYIRHGEEVQDDTEAVYVNSQWLNDRQFELMELTDPIDGHKAANLLYASDQLIFVLDELTLAAYARFGDDLKKSKTVRLLQHFIGKPGTSIVINQQAGSSIDEVQLERGLQVAITEQAYEQFVSRMTSDNSGHRPLLFRSSFDLARRANNALRDALRDAGPTSTSAAAWDHFSSLYAASGLTEIKRAIEGTAKESSKGPADNRTTAASVFTLYRSLEHASLSLNRDVEHARRAFEAADALMAEVRAEREIAVRTTFALSSDPSDRASAVHERAGDRSKSVQAANIDAWNIVENTFARRLPWYKILWKVDDVRAETETAIARGFAKQLEQSLILQTGRLYSVAERLHRNVRNLFTSLNDRSASVVNGSQQRDKSSRDPFRSPVLLNELRKHPLEKIDAELKSDVLLQPITTRRAQLVAPGGPLDLLCRRAQKNALTTVSTVGVAGLATVTAGMAGSTTFGSAFPTFVHHFALQPSTAAAAFGFTALSSLWLTQSRWTRAKKRFWRDWQRLSDGMEVDLQANLRSTFDRIIAAQNVVAANGLREKASKYVTEIESAQATIDALLLDLRQETKRKAPSEK